ncbi:ATP-binding protein [uncultured Chitinophaga sp.]|uniref:NACHT and WD repeat domain-containing protein n=1 Tax=uncultured Chitinophaga sp. TaxID=339340 RepID=UPI0025E5223A|nr:ATP-binding protein [uncultured Chitinophaga sp.]
MPDTDLPLSPFKLFDSFSDKDEAFFFGRETETDDLYQMAQESNIVLVFGYSGTGKTSLVQCGLVNNTKHFRWNTILVRRLNDINEALPARLKESIDPALHEEVKHLSTPALLKEAYMDNFRPVLLIFDQFEELFVFGKEVERAAFYKTLQELSRLDIPCKMIFVIREEFLGSLNDLELLEPEIFKKRLRVSPMTDRGARNMIIDTCGFFDIKLRGSKPDDTPDPSGRTRLDKPNHVQWNHEVAAAIVAEATRNGAVNLPYLQVFMDALWTEARDRGPDNIVIDLPLIDWVKTKGNVLKYFLDTRIAGQTFVSPEDTWKVLKLFLSDRIDIKKHVGKEDFISIPIATKNLELLRGYLVDKGVIRKVDEGVVEPEDEKEIYELAHESLVPIIRGVKITGLRPKLKVPNIQGNPYKGLESYNIKDNTKFYGRKEVVKILVEKVRNQPLVVVVGNSGVGKSSLVKAGVFPQMRNDGWEMLEPLRAGEQPLVAIAKRLEDCVANRQKKYIMLIDQFEEIVTRIGDRKEQELIYQRLFELLEMQKDKHKPYDLRIIATIRADFEPQFRIIKLLNNYWEAGRYIVPPFTREEICEAIEEPAYQAGLEFAPPSLVDKIADEVYSSQTTGLLPLMSFSLSEMYTRYWNRVKDLPEAQRDGVLRESDYDAVGGVMLALPTRADEVYDGFQESHPADYHKFQEVIKNIILRMVYFSPGELAGQRVDRQDFIYPDNGKNERVKKVLEKLLDSRLIVSGEDQGKRAYYEPAHDVLVKTWPRIWEWINDSGKDRLLLQSRLKAALEERRPGGWWNDVRLNELEKVMNADDNWLNKKEYAFAEKSIRLRNREHTKKARRNRRLIVGLSLGILVFGAVGSFAFFQMRKANKSLTKNRELSASLTEQVEVNKVARAKAEMASEQANQQRAVAIQAQAQAENARIIAMNAGEQLKTKLVLLELANAEVDKQRKLMVEKNATLSKSKALTDSLLIVEQSAVAKYRLAYDSIRDISAANVKQLIALAGTQKSKDMATAYRIAQIASQRDPSNAEAAAFFKDLANERTFYLTRRLHGNIFDISADGKLLLVASSTGRMLRLVDLNTFKTIDSTMLSPGLLSARFQHSGKVVMLVYPGRVRMLRASGLYDQDTFGGLDGDNIAAASMSPDGSLILMIDKGKLKIYTNFLRANERAVQKFRDKQFNFDDNVTAAVFTANGKTVIATTEKGSTYFVNTDDGRYNTIGSRKSFTTASLSPTGNYVVTGNRTDFDVYDSRGTRVNPFRKPDGIASFDGALFSADGRWLLINYSKFSEKSMSQNMQNTPSGQPMVFLTELDCKSCLLKEPVDMSAVYMTTLFGSKAKVQVLDSARLLIADAHGAMSYVDYLSGKTILLRMPAGDQGDVAYVAGKSYIFANSGDSLSLWQYGRGADFDKNNQLPLLTDSELKAFGITR